MRSKNVVVAGIVLALVGVVVSVARDGAPQASAGREYGILRASGGVFSWYGPAGSVRNQPPSEFADIMDVPRASDPAALEINLLNGLERQGWQLTFVPQAGVYVFARALPNRSR